MGAVARNPGILTALVVGALVAWFVLIVAVTSSFRDPAALAIFRNDVHYLPDILMRLPIHFTYVFLVALFLLAGAGAGDMILALLKITDLGRLQRIAFAICLGIVAWLFALSVVGYAGYLTKAVLYPLLIAGLALTFYRAWRARNARAEEAAPKPTSRWSVVLWVCFGLLLACDLYVALLAALMPEVQFDGRYYHLAEALRYALHGRIFDLVKDTRLLPFALPHYQEVLYSATIALFGLPAAKVLSWSNLVLSVLTIFAFAIEFFRSRLVGLFASLIFVSTPIVAWSGSTAGNDLSLAPFTVLSVFAFLRWKADPTSWRWLFVAGLLGGFAFGIKPFGAFNIVVLTLVIAAFCVRIATTGNGTTSALKMTARMLLPFAAGCLLAALPSLIRSTVITGNPFFPALNGIFHSRYVTPAILATLTNAYQHYGADTSWSAFFLLPWNATVHSDQFRNILGPLFLWSAPFLVLALPLARRRSLPSLLLAYGFFWTLFWYSSRATEIRYSEAIMPFAALVIAAIALPPRPQERVFASKTERAVVFTITLVAVILNSQFLVPFQRHALLGYVSGLATIHYPYLYEGAPERDVQLQYVPMLEYINGHLDPHKDKVYDDADGMLFNAYSDIDLFNGTGYDGPTANGEWSLFSADAYDRLRQNGITYVMIFQAAEPQLRNAPLFRRLQLVHRTPASLLHVGQPDHGVALYRVL